MPPGTYTTIKKGVLTMDNEIVTTAVATEEEGDKFTEIINHIFGKLLKVFVKLLLKFGIKISF